MKPLLKPDQRDKLALGEDAEEDVSYQTNGVGNVLMKYILG